MSRRSSRRPPAKRELGDQIGTACRRGRTAALPDRATTLNEQCPGSGKTVGAEPVKPAAWAPLFTLLPLPATIHPPALLKPGKDRVDTAHLAPGVLGDLQPVQLVVRPHQRLQHIKGRGGHT